MIKKTISKPMLKAKLLIIWSSNYLICSNSGRLIVGDRKVSQI